MKIQPGIAVSPRKTEFGPIMFSGRLNEGLDVLHQAGFKYVELSLRKPQDVNLDELKQKLSELDLKVTSVATGQAYMVDRLSLGSDDSKVRNKAIEHFKRMTDFGKELGAGSMILGGMRGSLVGTGREYERNYQNALAAIREVAQYAGDQDIPLVFEPINRYETNWIHTTQEGLDFLAELEVESAKLLLDTFHMNIEEISMVDAIKKAGDKIGYVHFADNTRHPPGQGSIDYRTVIDALISIDYCGPVVVEALPLPDDKTAVLNTARFWQEMDVSL